MHFEWCTASSALLRVANWRRCKILLAKRRALGNCFIICMLHSEYLQNAYDRSEHVTSTSHLFCIAAALRLLQKNNHFNETHSLKCIKDEVLFVSQRAPCHSRMAWTISKAIYYNLKRSLCEMAAKLHFIGSSARKMNQQIKTESSALYKMHHSIVGNSEFAP